MGVDLYHYYGPLLRRLERLKIGDDGTRGTARCPAHDDFNPSLEWWITFKGDLCVKCHKGCSFSAIAAALDADETEFWRPKKGPHPSTRKPQMTNPVRQWDYKDEQGTLLYRKYRWATGPEGRGKTYSFHRPDGKGGWLPGLNQGGVCQVRRVLYRLPELADDPQRLLCVPEGEKCVEALRSLGLLATCNDDGGERGKWRFHYAPMMMPAGPRPFAVFPDDSDIGREHGAAILGSLLAQGVESVRLVEVKGFGREGDVADLIESLLRDGNTREDAGRLVRQMIRSAPEWGLVSRKARAA